MSQSNIITREQAVYIGTESTFGVTPAGSFPNAMTRFFCLQDEAGVTPKTEMLEVNDVRVRRADAIQPVHGLEMASEATFTMNLKTTPSGAQLPAAGTAGSLTPRIVLAHVLGTEYAEAGDTIASAASSTAFTVTDGTKFKKGTWIAVEVSTGVMEAALITNISTNALTVTPALSGTPTGTIVRNLYNYALAESHTNTLTIQKGFVGDTTAQYTMNGCYGNATFDFAFGQIPKMTLALTATKNTTGDQSLSTANASDEMGAAFAVKNLQVMLATSLSRASTFKCEKVEVMITSEWQAFRDPSGVETVGGVVNTAGRPRPGTVKVATRYDNDWQTGFAADTAYDFLMIFREGTGTTASFWIVDCGNLALIEQPVPTKVAGELMGFELTFGMRQDDRVTVGGDSGTQLDRDYSPVRIAFG